MVLDIFYYMFFSYTSILMYKRVFGACNTLRNIKTLLSFIKMHSFTEVLFQIVLKGILQI